MSIIWAKSKKENNEPISLSRHINDLLKVFQNLSKYIKDDEIKNIIKLSIILHDFGKAFPSFQIRTLGNKDYDPQYIYHNLPHSLLSILLINKEKLPIKYKNLILSSIAFHHWRENFIDILTNSNEFGSLYQDIKNYIPKIEENLKNELEYVKADININIKELVKFQDEIAVGLSNDIPFYEYVIPSYHYYWLPKRIELDEIMKRNWILISGFLQRSDHYASYCEEELDENCINQPDIDNLKVEEIKQNILNNIKESNPNIKIENLWQFQIFEKIKDNNVILIAPTGYGKTELAFLWSNEEKLFYTLPIRAAVNQMFKRASKIFKNDLTGLLHSDADVFLYSDGGENQSNFRSYELSRQLSYPFILSTGDQFFPYAIKPPGYEKIYATFSYSRLVIDEIQAYNPKATAIIVKYIEDISKLGGKFLLMTATMPNYVIEEINKRIENKFEYINIYEQEKEKFENIKKHKIELISIKNDKENNKTIFQLPNEEIEKIINEAKEGKRVIVIVNTIKFAQQIFEDIKNVNIKKFLLHSNFTINDRQEIEKKIADEFKNPKDKNENEGKILIATQVVEASLDIDGDVLFTEIAPMDSLVQRMGRILRRYGPHSKPMDIPTIDKPNVFIWIFKNGLQSGESFVYDQDVVESTIGLLIDREIKENKKYDIEKIFEKNSVIELDFISEYDKYKLVSYLYNSLSPDSKYIKTFKETLSILDAGFMAENKDQAEKLFREIYSISVIPQSFQNVFIEDCKRFLEQFSNEKNQYVKFKKEILSKYVLSLNVHKFKNIIRYKVSDWFDVENFEADALNKLKRWCNDLYFVEINYDNLIGCKFDEKKSFINEY